MRWRCTIMPVTPTISARAQRSKSIGSTFSSMMVTVCSAGVSAAEQRQRRDRHVGALADEGQRMLETPEGNLELRIDQDDVGHRITRRCKHDGSCNALAGSKVSRRGTRGFPAAKAVAEARPVIAVEPTGPRVARPDDRLRDEAIQLCAIVLDRFASLAMTLCGYSSGSLVAFQRDDLVW
jgi:hypothetical protein